MSNALPGPVPGPVPGRFVIGAVEVDERGRRWLAPFDARLALDLPILRADEVPSGHFVVVDVERAGSRRRPRGRIVEVLGDPAVPGVDVAVVLRHYGIPDAFPPEAEAAAAAFPSDPRPADWSGREDLRGATVVTIDGESARDFDDAVSISRLHGGVFRLGVHIADVAHYVAEGDALDGEAYRRGTSVYYPERAVPMLPEALSNGLCSLRPQVPRLTLSVFLDIDRDGRVLARRFAETVIASARRLTYSEVRRVLEEPRAADRSDYEAVLPALREMHHLMQILNHARTLRGSLDFDLPEGSVELDTDGTMVGVLPDERNVAHRLIEEFMIAANEAVAFELCSRQIPSLYRVHEAPGRERLAELAELLRPLGIELRGDLDNLPPGALQDVLRQARGKPAEPFVSTVVLRSLQRARYAPECDGHYALASHYYTHFTSPIRRYPDLVVHRRLKAFLHRTASADSDLERLRERLPEIAEHASATERRAEQSERDLLQWKKVRFLAGRAGERFTGRITGVQPFGLFVQLDGFHVDGLVPIRSLGDDFYLFEPEAHRLVGERRGRVFKLADAVEVELAGADLRRRGLDLRLVGMPEPAARPGSPRGRERGEPLPPGRRRRGPSSPASRRQPGGSSPPGRRQPRGRGPREK
ncbi:MAG TPA: ribonuclease R [Thermoanaerobaculia bacterium]|nr:ribonuclease R [Thermoanaerobaculia bacterium]